MWTRERVARWLSRATGPLGLETRRLTHGAWLVRRRGGPRLRVRRLDPHSWLVHRGRSHRQVTTLGSPRLQAQLVLGPPALGPGRGKVQKLLGKHVGDLRLIRILEHYGIDCVLDVGANTGQYAQRLRDLGYRGRIVSFEPLEAFAAELREHAAADPDWLVFDCALGDDEGTAEINATPAKISSLLPASDFGRSWSAKLRESHTETIRIRRLSSVLDEATAGMSAPRIFLKLDTQGYDLEAFRGAGDRIQEVIGLQSEVAFLSIYEGMPRFTDQIAAYEAAGFEVAGFSPVSSHGATLRAIECDVVMVRASAAP